MNFLPFTPVEQRLAERLSGIDFYVEVQCMHCKREAHYRSSLPYPSNVVCKCRNPLKPFLITKRSAFYEGVKINAHVWAELARKEIMDLVNQLSDEDR